VPVTYATQRFYGRWHPWRRPTVRRLVEHWIVAHEIFEKDARALGDVIVVRYEELTERPREVLGGVAEELGIPREFPDMPIDVTRDRSRRYFEAWDRYLRHPILGARRGRWVERADVAVARWGYSLRP
jgi:hypothetical protein